LEFYLFTLFFFVLETLPPQQQGLSPRGVPPVIKFVSPNLVPSSRKAAPPPFLPPLSFPSDPPPKKTNQTPPPPRPLFSSGPHPPPPVKVFFFHRMTINSCSFSAGDEMEHFFLSGLPDLVVPAFRSQFPCPFNLRELAGLVCHHFAFKLSCFAVFFPHCIFVFCLWVYGVCCFFCPPLNFQCFGFSLFPMVRIRDDRKAGFSLDTSSGSPVSRRVGLFQLPS